MSSTSSRCNKQASEDTTGDSLTTSLSTSPQTTTNYRRLQPRERRNPSVTPRKFKKFFTPRTQANIPTSSARQALRELSIPSLNQNTLPNALPRFRNVDEQENKPFPRGLKRRKVLHVESTPDVTSKEAAFLPLQEYQPRDTTWEHPQSSPCARALRLETDSDDDDEELGTIATNTVTSRDPVQRIVPIRSRGLGMQLLSRRIAHYQHPHLSPINGKRIRKILERYTKCSRLPN
jgi:hypothetical protein